MNLHTYIDFSIKYKLLVGNNLNNDIKKYIWNIYKKITAQDVLIKGFKKIRIRFCRDCNKPNWNILNTRKQKFYSVSACDHQEYDYLDISCCIKYICIRQCRFKINCVNCGKNIIYVPPNLENDIGWNHIEGKKRLKIFCELCGYENIKPLVWNNENHSLTINNMV